MTNKSGANNISLPEKSVNILNLKEKAIGFPEPIKTLILSEPDNITLSNYLSKMETWERLLKMESYNGKNKRE